MRGNPDRQPIATRIAAGKHTKACIPRTKGAASCAECTQEIQNQTYYFRTGHLVNANQVLISAQLPELVMIEFDKDGGYMRTLVKELPHELLSSIKGRLWIDSDDLFIEIDKWANETGIKQGTISVQKFYIPERSIGIRDLPDHYQEAIDQADDYDEDERREILEDVHLWCERGDFVLWFTQDYYMTAEGEVDST
jgi:hypothetical protein